MGILEVVKKGFSVAQRSANLILLLFAFSFVWNLINIPFQGREAEVGASVTLMVLAILFVLASIFVQAGSLGYVHNVVKEGKAALGDFVNAGKKYYLRILGVGLIVALFVIILSIFALLAILVGGGEPNPVSVTLSVILGVLGLIGVFLLFMAPYIVIADDARVVQAIQMSIQIVKQNIVKILGIGIILIVIGFAIGFVLGIILGLVGTLMGPTGNLIVAGFLNSVVNAYLGVVTTGAFMAFYLALKGPSAATEQPAQPA